MKRAQLNLALLAVAIGLGVTVFIANKKAPPGPPLTPFKADAVTRVAIEHPGAAAIRLEKQDGKWQLAAPVIAEADEFEVNGIIGLADRETRRTLEGGSMKELGLEPPKFTLTLNDSAIAFGDTEPLEYRRYVRTGAGAFLVEDPPGASMDREYADLVSKNLLPPGTEIERIELPRLTLVKADGKWSVIPADPKATADAMQALADGWTNARSMWNEMLRDGKAAGDKVRITLKGGVAREFVVTALEPQLKLSRPELGVTFVMSKALAVDLLKLPEPKEEAKP